MNKFFYTLLLLILILSVADAQDLNYSNRKEYLGQQLENLRLLPDSFYLADNDYVNSRQSRVTGNSFIHPYYSDNSWKSGTIWYFGKEYKVPMLKYDLEKDMLIYVLYTKGSINPVSFEKEFVRAFSIEGRNFVYLDDFEPSAQNKLRHGYHEVVYDGAEKFYIRREKQKNVEKDPLDQNYSTWTYFFLKKDGKYTRVKGNADFLKALDDHKKELRAYMRENNLRFRAGDYTDAVSILEYYDKIKRNG